MRVSGMSCSYHFLQREAFGLRNKEPDKGRTETGQQAKDDVGPIRDAFEHYGRELPDSEIIPIPN